MLFSLSCLFAQDNQTLGLTLSGGGAKGLAHIGVLKALEQENIPIDYICGTSMGAIIGGLYASGYSVDEIENIFLSKEFDALLSGIIEQDIEPLYYKDKDDASILKINLNAENKLKASLPMSFVNPTRLDYAFMTFFSSATKACMGDFNKLMIPFFCVATNVTDNTQEVLRKGDLSSSIRASMTFPFVFAPIELDGKMMCDGGIYNNFPAKEMQDFYSPTLIIGSKVVNNYDNPNNDDIILYIENMITYDTKYDIPTDNGIIIETDMSDISVMDFDKKKECIDRGYNNALKYIKEIKQRISRTQSQEELSEKRKAFEEKKTKITIGNIIIKGVKDKQKHFFEHLLTQNLHDDTLTLESLRDNYLALSVYPNIKSISPYIYYDYFLSEYVLELNIRTQKTLTTKIGGIISSDPISNIFLGLDYTSIRKYAWRHKINGYIGRYYKSFMYDIALHVPNPVAPFVLEGVLNINRWNFYRSHSPLFEYSAINYMIQNENNAQIKLSFPISRRDKCVFKVGYGITDDDYFLKDYILSTDTSDNTKFSHFVLGFKREYNSLDNNLLPTKGVFSKINIQYVNGVERFYAGNKTDDYQDYKRKHAWAQINFENKIYTPINKRYSLGFNTKVFYSFQDLFYTKKNSLLNAGVYAPSLESLTSFYPEYRSNQYLAGGLEQVFKLGSFILGGLEFRLGTYAFVPIRQILENKQMQPYYGEFFKKAYGIVTSSLVLATRLGNISMSLSYHQREDMNTNPWNFTVSFGTIVFNEKNIDR